MISLKSSRLSTNKVIQHRPDAANLLPLRNCLVLSLPIIPSRHRKRRVLCRSISGVGHARASPKACALVGRIYSYRAEKQRARSVGEGSTLSALLTCGACDSRPRRAATLHLRVRAWRS